MAGSSLIAWRTERRPLLLLLYTSTIVFLVRKGNLKKIHDRDDLVRPGETADHPQPEDLGGAR